MHEIDYFFDFLSPYSYFSWVNREKLLSQGLKINYRPLPMGSLFSKNEMKGPGQIKPKREYMLKQCFQYAALHKIPFIPPKSHPFNPLYSLRLATSCLAKENQEQIISLLWEQSWAKGEDISDPDILEALLSSHGLNGKELIDACTDRAPKIEIKNNIQDALKQGVFGVPSYLYQGEIFWGNDMIETLIDFKNQKLPSWNVSLYKQRLGIVDQ